MMADGTPFDGTRIFIAPVGVDPATVGVGRLEFNDGVSPAWTDLGETVTDWTFTPEPSLSAAEDDDLSGDSTWSLTPWQRQTLTIALGPIAARRLEALLFGRPRDVCPRDVCLERYHRPAASHVALSSSPPARHPVFPWLRHPRSR